MKKEVKAVIAVILAVWFFLMGFEIGGYNEKKKINSQQPVTAPVINTTSNPLTTAAPIETTTSAPVQTTATAEASKADDGTVTTKQAKPEEENPAALSKTQVVEKVAAALNAAKAEKEMTATKKEIVTINVTECSVQQAVSMINSIINKLAGGNGYLSICKRSGSRY